LTAAPVVQEVIYWSVCAIEEKWGVDETRDRQTLAISLFSIANWAGVYNCRIVLTFHEYQVHDVNRQDIVNFH